METDRILLLNQVIQNFQVKLMDAGDKLCDKSWDCVDELFPYDSIGYVKTGGIFIEVNGRGGELGHGGMYYIPARNRYSHRVIGECARVYWTHFRMGNELSAGIVFPVTAQPASPEKVERIYQEMFLNRAEEVLGAPLMDTGLMCQLAASFLTACGENVAFQRAGGLGKMEKAAAYIQANLSKNLTVEELASQAGLNPHYFIKVFQQYFKETPIQFVLNQREKAARSMLENSRMSVKEIGLSLGFSNQNYFSEFFKKRSGYSPSEYRNLKGVL